jgi:hypothetical protein
MMKDFKYYEKPQLSYPKKEDYTNVYIYDRGKLIWEGFVSDKEGRNKVMRAYPNAVVQKVVDEEAYKAHKIQYAEEVHKLQEEFINDLFREFGVEDNPKREAAYALAYEYGHANGYSEICNHFSDLVNLIKD